MLGYPNVSLKILPTKTFGDKFQDTYIFKMTLNKTNQYNITCFEYIIVISFADKSHYK